MAIVRVETEWEGRYFPTWRCICDDGEIRPNERTLTRLETIESDMAASEGAEWREYTFAVLATCSRCYDHSVVGGIVRSEPGHEVYSVNLFSPSPIIVPRRSGMSAKLRAILARAEVLSWSDVPAAANALRSALEQVLTDRGVPTSVTSPNGRASVLRLHQRVERFAEASSDLEDHLFAVKWLGNDGAHADATLSREDLFDAFEQLDHVFEQVFDGTLAKLKRKASEINQNKGPRRSRS
jgi:hypothetical protein